MNDWRNDPPDYPEPPYCCDDYMTVFPDGVCVCDRCGLRVAPAPEWEPCGELEPDELPDDFYQGPEKCPHGNEWTDCDACDHLGDLAYDAAKERR
jgi:hypothetical protein